MEIYFSTHGPKKKKVSEKLLFDKRKQFVLVHLCSRVCVLKMMDIDEGVKLYLFDRKYITELIEWKFQDFKNIFSKAFLSFHVELLKAFFPRK